jgi:hypothetical protein
MAVEEGAFMYISVDVNQIDCQKNLLLCVGEKSVFLYIY